MRRKCIPGRRAAPPAGCRDARRDVGGGARRSRLGRRSPTQPGQSVGGRPERGGEEGAHDGRCAVFGVAQREDDDDDQGQGGDRRQRRHAAEPERDAVGPAQGGLPAAQREERAELEQERHGIQQHVRDHETSANSE